MKLVTRVVLSAALSIAAMGAAGCNGSQPANRSNQPAAAAKPGRWIAQYRSPASLATAGVNLSVFFYSGISVVSPDVVYVCGDMPGATAEDERVGVILKTTDGGNNWSEIPINVPRMLVPTLNSIHFISADVGWAVGADSGQLGVVLRTTDGGASWTPSRLGHKQIPTTVFFADQNTGWVGGATPPPGEDEGVGGPSAILGTTDGGQTWSLQYNVPISIYDLSFVDNLTGWASGSKGVIYHTADGGRTWNTQRTEIEAGDFPGDPASEAAKQFAIRGIQFLDKDHGFAAAFSTEEEAGRLIVTVNGGAAWRRQWMVGDAGVRDIFFVNPNEGWAITSKGQYIYHTVDGGRSWLSEPRTFEQDTQLSRLGGADARHLWAVGGGAVFHRVEE
jgi:photosystem II stability/assembly factor-like uncharacterized protein